MEDAPWNGHMPADALSLPRRSGSSEDSKVTTALREVAARATGIPRGAANLGCLFPLARLFLRVGHSRLEKASGRHRRSILAPQRTECARLPRTCREQHAGAVPLLQRQRQIVAMHPS